MIADRSGEVWLCREHVFLVLRPTPSDRPMWACLRLADGSLSYIYEGNFLSAELIPPRATADFVRLT